MEKIIIAAKDSPSAIGPYSQAVKAGPFIFTSGILPLSPETGELVSGGIAEQTSKTLENLRAVLEKGGSSMGSVIKTTVFITDMNDFNLMNKIYGTFFSENHPARATVEVSRLAKDAKIEIEAVGICNNISEKQDL